MIAPSGGTTWTRAMFERQVVAEDYWKKQAATQPMLFPSNAPTSDAVVRGEIMVAALLYNAIFPKLRDGAPVKVFFAPEGAPLTPFAAGIPKTAANPNAARLFLNWCLSEEGQAMMIREIGNLTSLKKAPLYPEGFYPKVVKVWVPNYDEFVKGEGNEAARFHYISRLYGGNLADCITGATACDTGDRIPQQPIAWRVCGPSTRISPRPEGNRLCRGRERGD